MAIELISFPWEDGFEAPRRKKLNLDKVDITVLLGKNWENKKDIPKLAEGTEVTLSRDSVATAVAGGLLYQNGFTDELMISTGQTKVNYPTEAKAMDLTIGHYFSEDQVPQSARTLEEISFDTEGNAEEVAKKLKERDFKGKVRVVTVGHHVPRARAEFEDAGVPVLDAVASEDILNFYGYDVPRSRGTSIKNYGLEWGLRATRKVPHGNELIRKVTSLIRK